MSCDYRFKTKLRIKGGRATARTVETFTFPRADCVAALAKISAQTGLHDGEIMLREILTNALAQSGWENLTLTKKS